MFSNSVVRNSPDHRCALIGVGVRIDGNVVFSGMLHIQGEVHGDVSCDDGLDGTLFVDRSGDVTGAIKSPNIVVSGHVHGSMRSTESIEIHEGARIEGDTFYKEINIDEGGFVEGRLTHAPLVPKSQANAKLPGQLAPLAISSEAPALLAGGTKRVPRIGGGFKLATAFVVIATIVGFGLLNRTAISNVPTSPGAASIGDRSSPSALSASHEAVQRNQQKNIHESGPSEVMGDTSNNVTAILGLNPRKPAGTFSVIGDQPTVLFRKKRDDPTEGTRVEIPRGSRVVIKIADNEIVRVAKGGNVGIYFQGNKVAPETIARGAWIRFVPQVRAGRAGQG